VGLPFLALQFLQPVLPSDAWPLPLLAPHDETALIPAASWQQPHQMPLEHARPHFPARPAGSRTPSGTPAAPPRVPALAPRPASLPAALRKVPALALRLARGCAALRCESSLAASSSPAGAFPSGNPSRLGLALVAPPRTANCFSTFQASPLHLQPPRYHLRPEELSFALPAVHSSAPPLASDSQISRVGAVLLSFPSSSARHAALFQ